MARSINNQIESKSLLIRVFHSNRTESEVLRQILVFYVFTCIPNGFAVSCYGHHCVPHGVVNGRCYESPDELLCSVICMQPASSTLTCSFRSECEIRGRALHRQVSANHELVRPSFYRLRSSLPPRNSCAPF